jgi:hypothetical protein
VPSYELGNGRYFHAPSANEPDLREKTCGWLSVLKSWSIAWFYGPFAAVGVLVVIRTWTIKH